MIGSRKWPRRRQSRPHFKPAWMTQWELDRERWKREKAEARRKARLAKKRSRPT